MLRMHRLGTHQKKLPENGAGKPSQNKKKKESDSASDAENIVSEKSLMTSATAVEKVSQWQDYFLLDSGATYHSCGRNMKQLKDPITVETANGDVLVSGVGDVRLKLFNGLKVILRKDLYWENAS